MPETTDLNLLLGVWVAAGLIMLIAWLKRPHLSAGLGFIYFIALWLIHWPAAGLYALPWYWVEGSDLVRAGFEQSTYSVVALMVGAVWLGPGLLRVGRLKQSGGSATPNPRSPDARLPLTYVLIGLSSYLVIAPFFGHLPTVGALLSGTSQLLTVGLCLACWRTWHSGERHRFAAWIGLASGLPFFTVLTKGFLGYGVVSLVVVLTFVAGFFRPRWILIPMALLVGYLGLSLYVTYIRDRDMIRNSVWGGESMGDRVGQLGRTATTFEWFGWRDQAHLNRIDIRLNQNILVGAAASYLSAGQINYAAGSTLWQAALAVVPRAIWPEKPVRAGSPQLVTTYTGIPFAQGTSVGVGQVMEFYINFGTAGVVAGFLVLGCLIAIFDALAARHLRRGDWPGFTLWFLPALGFLQTGGSLVEVTSTVGASFVTVILVHRFLIPIVLRRESEDGDTRLVFPLRSRRAHGALKRSVRH